MAEKPKILSKDEVRMLRELGSMPGYRFGANRLLILSACDSIETLRAKLDAAKKDSRHIDHFAIRNQTLQHQLDARQAVIESHRTVMQRIYEVLHEELTSKNAEQGESPA